ncbi:hypothetical protein SVIOM342S_01638 [Streptomyces violaceorubidus]
MRLEETPAFAAEMEKAETERPKVPLREMVTGQWRALLLCVGLVLVFNVTDYMLLSYMPSYLTSELRYDETHGLLVVLGVMALMMVVQPFAGALTDRVGRRPVIAAGCAGFLLLSVPALLLIRQGSLLAVALGMGALGLLLVCFTASMPSALPALFPTRVRYGSLSIGFNVSVSLFGGTTPLVVTALIGATGKHDDARVLHDGRGRGRRRGGVVHDRVGGTPAAGLGTGGRGPSIARTGPCRWPGTADTVALRCGLRAALPDCRGDGQTCAGAGLPRLPRPGGPGGALVRADGRGRRIP